MLKRLRKNHPLIYCIGAEAVFLGSLFVSSYLVVIALLLFRFNFAYADDYLLGCIQELVGIGVAVEKGFQHGGDALREKGYPIHSLAVIEEATPDHITFREDDPV